jgi:hypothetical protein
MIMKYVSLITVAVTLAGLAACVGEDPTLQTGDTAKENGTPTDDPDVGQAEKDSSSPATQNDSGNQNIDSGSDGGGTPNAPDSGSCERLPTKDGACLEFEKQRWWNCDVNSAPPTESQCTPVGGVPVGYNFCCK